MSAVYGKTTEGLHICVDTADIAVAMCLNHTIDLKYKSAHLVGQRVVFKTKKEARDFYDKIVKSMGVEIPLEDEDVTEPKP